MASHKVETRLKRKASIRKKLSGTAERPRLSIFRSSKHVYAQVIDDVARTTLAAVSSLDETLVEKLKGQKKAEKAKLIGQAIAERCKQKGIKKVVFDRNGYIYHGRVLSLAQGAREGGLEF